MLCDLVQHSCNQWHFILLRQASIDGRELLIVSRPVIGWQTQLGQQTPACFCWVRSIVPARLVRVAESAGPRLILNL